MKLVSANPQPQVTRLEELPGKVNYFIGNDPTKWRANIPTYAKVKYEDVYPGVDLVYYGTQRQLEYDFVVAPGADPGAITLAFEGLVGAGPCACPQEGDHRGSPLQIDDNGDFIVHIPGGALSLHKPRVYQQINGVKQDIPGCYVLLPLSPQAGHPTSALPVGEG
ncbi:MAG: hypothetical protein HY347_06320, partial [candidate division NC10 bacterium]|nr:hypothetical protein [candidate division NC10 bacterium]